MIMRRIRYIVAAVLIALAFAACDSEGDKFDYQKVGLLISGGDRSPGHRYGPGAFL